MHSLETILSFLALVGCAALLLNPIIHFQEHLHATTETWKEKWEQLECSRAADAALSQFVRTPNPNCWQFSYALQTGNGFALYLGGDSNHYAP